MKQFMKTCRECWVVTIIVSCLFVANGIDMTLRVKAHHFNLSPVLRILDILR